MENRNREIKQMRDGKRKYLTAAVTALAVLLLSFAVHKIQTSFHAQKEQVKIGFVFDGDEATPYTANFIRAMDAVTMQFGDRVSMSVKNNVPYNEAEDVLRGLAQEHCDIIFTNSFGYSEAAKRMAGEYPDIEFCQATGNNANTAPVYANYHTFMGEICEGRYIAGKVAGRKLQELIDSGEVLQDEAWIGYVGAYPYAEVISGYTAFFLGVRAECSTARMRVRYTNTWTGYTLEKETAEALIAEGCVIISQHSDTIGPAVACENADADHPVFHVGYNQDMLDVAPTTSLIGTRIDWSPYICAAVEAVLSGRQIERVANGHVHGNDVGAGFAQGWVHMLELNRVIAAEGSAQMVEETIEAFCNESCDIFVGEYLGVNPENANDIYDLRGGYQENATSSAPTFSYVLKDVIVIE